MRNLIAKLLTIALIAYPCGSAFRTELANAGSLTPGNHSFRINVGGRDRNFVLHIPKNYDPAKAIPLVVAIHGGGGNAQNMEEMTGFSAKSDKEGFIVCYPNGTGTLGDRLLTWNTENCCGYALDNKVDDVAFIDAMLNDIGTKAKIDWNRIYATGISNGGMMSYLLGCRLSQRFAAIAPVAGALNFDCQPANPVSVCVIHGTGDQHVLYDGGVPKKTLDKSHPRVDKSVQYALDTWAQINKINKADVKKTVIYPKVERYNYPAGSKGAKLVHYKLIDFGHAWPGSTQKSSILDSSKCDINATDVIWDFFKSCVKSNPLSSVRYWACQYSNLEKSESIKALVDSKYDMLVLDRVSSVKGTESFDDKATVEKLHRAGKKVLCYINIGEAESYRSYWEKGWKNGTPEWILANDPDGWDGNHLVAFWHPQWQSLVIEKMLAPAIKAGFDGLYLDWVEIYKDETVRKSAAKAGFDTIKSLERFINNLRFEAEKLNPNIVFVCQNASELYTYPGIISNFDGISQESVWFGWSGDPDKPTVKTDIQVDAKESKKLVDNLLAWKKQGKSVYVIDYCQKQENMARSCFYGDKYGFSNYCAPVALDKLPSIKNYARSMQYMEITVDKNTRSFYAYKPSGFDSSRQYPAVVMLHGGAGSAVKMIENTDWMKKADKEKFVVVFPNGTGTGGLQGWNAGKCCGEGQKKGVDDVKFLTTMASMLGSWNVDRKNIFVTGVSLGGMMCYMLACKTNGVFAGFASVAGNLMVDAKPTSPVPFMEIHSTDDKAVPYNGGGIHLSVEASLKVIRDGNFCASDPVVTTGKLGSKKFVWKGKKDVMHWKLTEGGHSWPGISDKSSKAIIATDEIWLFFSSYITI